MPARDDKPQQAAPPMINAATHTTLFAARLAQPRSIAARNHLLRQSAANLGTLLFRRFDVSNPFVRTSTNFMVARASLAPNPLVWLSSLQHTFDSDQQDAPPGAFNAPRWENTVAPPSARPQVQLSRTDSRATPASTLLPLIHRAALVQPQPITTTQPAQLGMLHQASITAPWLQRAPDRIGQTASSALPQHGQAASTSQSPALIYRATLVPLQPQPITTTQPVQSGMLHRAIAVTPLLRRAPDAAPQATRSLHTPATSPLIYRSMLPFNAARITNQPPGVAQSAVPGSTTAPVATRIVSLAQRTFATPQTSLVQPLRPAVVLRLWHAPPAVRAPSTAEQRFAALSAQLTARVSQSAARGSAPASAATPLMRRTSHQTRLIARSEFQQAAIIQHARGDHTAAASEFAHTALPLAATTAQVMLQRIAQSQLMPAAARPPRDGPMLQRLHRAVATAAQPQQHASGLQRSITPGVAWQPVLQPFVQRNADPRSAQATNTAPADKWQPATSYSVAANSPRVQHASTPAALTSATPIQRTAAIADTQRRVAAVLRVSAPTRAPGAIAQRQLSEQANRAPTANQPARVTPATLTRSVQGVQVPSSAISRAWSATFAATRAQRHLASASGQPAPFALATSIGAIAIQRAGIAGSGAWNAPFVRAVTRRFTNDSRAPAAGTLSHSATSVMRAASNSPAPASQPRMKRASEEGPNVTSAQLIPNSGQSIHFESLTPGPSPSGRGESQALMRATNIARISNRFVGLMRAAYRLPMLNRGAVSSALAQSFTQPTARSQSRWARGTELTRPHALRAQNPVQLVHRFSISRSSNASTLAPASLDLLQPTRSTAPASDTLRAALPAMLAVVQAAQRSSLSSSVAQRADRARMVTPLIAAAPVQRTRLARTQQPGGFTVLRRSAAPSRGMPAAARATVADRSGTTAAGQPRLALLQPKRRAPMPGSESGTVLRHAPVQRATARTQHAAPAPTSSVPVQATPRSTRVSLVQHHHAQSGTHGNDSAGFQPIASARLALLQPFRSVGNAPAADRAPSLLQLFRAAQIAETPIVLRRTPGVQQHTATRQSDAGMQAGLTRAQQRRSTLTQPAGSLAFVQPWRSATSPGGMTQRTAPLGKYTRFESLTPSRSPRMREEREGRRRESPQRSMPSTQTQRAGTRPTLAARQPLTNVLLRRMAEQQFTPATQHGAVLRLPMLSSAEPRAVFAHSSVMQRESAASAAARGAAPRVSQMNTQLVQAQLFAMHAATSTRRAAVQRIAARGADLPLLARASSGKSEAERSAMSFDVRRVIQRVPASITPALSPRQQPTSAMPTSRTYVARALLAANRSPQTALADMRVFAQSQPAAAQGSQPNTSHAPAAVQRSTARSPLVHQQPSFTSGSMHTMPLASGNAAQVTALPMLQRWPISNTGALASNQTNTARVARTSLAARSSMQPTALADMRVFTQPAAAAQTNATDEVRAGAAVQRNTLSLTSVQPIRQPDRATTAVSAKNGAVQRTNATAAALPFVQSGGQATASITQAVAASGPVGTVLQRVERPAARADMPRDLLRPASPRAAETTAPIQRQQSSVVEARAEETTDESNVDIEALAQEVYARLRRRLAVEAERIGR